MVCCLAIGVALSIVSVPVAALVSQRWGAFSGGSAMLGDMYRLRDDGVYFLTEHHSPRVHSAGGTTGGQRGIIMRLRSSTQAGPLYAQQFLEGPNALEPLATDPRPPFLRSPPREGYTTVEGVSAGWPWHAAFGLRHRAGGKPSLDEGLVTLPMSSRGDMLPWRPIWGGLAANTLLYSAVVLAMWAGYRVMRVVLRRRRGGCTGCGYPLDDGMTRCPECGKAAPASDAATLDRPKSG